MQVDLLKRKFGFDDAFNYKEETDLDAALKGQYLYILLNEISCSEALVNNRISDGDKVVASVLHIIYICVCVYIFITIKDNIQGLDYYNVTKYYWLLGEFHGLCY